MMKNKILLMLAFLFTGLLNAQDSTKNTPEVKAKKASEKMKTKYALSDVQYIKIYDVNLDYYKKRAELIGKDSKPTQKMEKRKALEVSRDSKFKTILTAEQYAKWTKEKNNKDGEKDEKYGIKGKVKNENKSDGEGSGEESGERTKGKNKGRVQVKDKDDNHIEKEHNDGDSTKHK